MDSVAPVMVKAASSAPPAKVNVCVSARLESVAVSVPTVALAALFSEMWEGESAMAVGAVFEGGGTPISTLKIVPLSPTPPPEAVP